jgi:hypothetical protein
VRDLDLHVTSMAHTNERARANENARRHACAGAYRRPRIDDSSKLVALGCQPLAHLRTRRIVTNRRDHLHFPAMGRNPRSIADDGVAQQLLSLTSGVVVDDVHI